MIDEQTEELASLYALDMLEPDETAAFEARLGTDAELQQLVEELRETAANLAYAAPARTLPPELESRVLRAVRSEKSTARAGIHTPWMNTSWVPWAIAASLAIFCGLLLLSRAKLSKDLAELQENASTSQSQVATLTSDRDRLSNAVAENQERAETAQAQVARLSADRDALAKKVAQLEEQDVSSRVQAAKLTADRDSLKDKVAQLERTSSSANVQVAKLTSKMDAAPEAVATITWDGAKQEGTLKAVDVPPNPTGRDYQLWIIDPRYKQPVDAGVFTVNKEGVTEIVFRPKLRIASAKAFAVSLERKGGVEKAEGPMVLTQ